MSTDKLKILVLGDGAWGTALSLVLNDNGYQVTLWSNFPDYAKYLAKKRENTKFLPGIKIPQSIDITCNLQPETYNLIVMAVPTQYCRGVLSQIKSRIPHLASRIPIVSVAKGIEQKTLKRPSQIIQEVLGYPKDKIAVLSGPTHAEEVVRKKPASAVIATTNQRLAKQLQNVFMNEYFRIYSQRDVIGVESAGALKNIIAIAGGICDGLNLGDNAKSALLTRGIVEITRLGEALGGKRDTFFGLAGIGDLITTCFSPYGRNRAVGIRLGRGETLQEILKSMQMVAEGVWTTKAVRTLARQYHIEMPIAQEVYNILFKNKDPMKAVYSLMTRRAKAE
ncbi:MAG: NAD(P)H-dependent glycerol-3-phosphate dehydrogenase [Planctomycetota bacterium]|nr:NAD(P)H-dependent glycerol-3-phosphate dehydrogenase [Planctomycetota bacterium]MDI6787452.1 NAD(P)H-dependent glycerol-3-phosphate dehydrogenase [Planctomycetota bacterium]